METIPSGILEGMERDGRLGGKGKGGTVGTRGESRALDAWLTWFACCDIYFCTSAPSQLTCLLTPEIHVGYNMKSLPKMDNLETGRTPVVLKES